jgi:hypothetical protein
VEYDLKWDTKILEEIFANQFKEHVKEIASKTEQHMQTVDCDSTKEYLAVFMSVGVEIFQTMYSWANQ